MILGAQGGTLSKELWFVWQCIGWYIGTIDGPDKMGRA